MKINKYGFCVLFCILFLFSEVVNAQVELVPASNKIYDFLDRMLVNGVIENYSSSMIPVSRREIAGYLVEIKGKSSRLTKTDKKFLNDFIVEFEYDMKHSLKNSSSFFSGFKFNDIFSDKKQKYLYSNADSNSSFFWDALGEINYVGSDGDSLGKPHILLGRLGTRIRGTLFGSVGYYLRLSNGVRLSGESRDAVFASEFDPILASTRKFVSEGGKTFDSFEGYLRYTPSGDWLGLTVGREALRFGTGFIDNLVISNRNSAPFDFIKLDLSYKKIKYTFLHSSIVGNDSSGNQLESKYLVFHRLEIGPLFKGFMRLGFNEMLVYSNIPINLAFLNPIVFLTSADLNTELPGKNSNNTLIAIDAQFYPAKKLSLQGTWLIDDLNFETLGNSDKSANDNKFGFQAGMSWQDAFTLKNLNLVYEYTKIDPFVYSHRDINNSYSNLNLPIGAALNPNSDEHAVRLSYDIGSRLNITFTFKHQRSGMNITDSTGQIVTNVGSNILHGEGDFLTKNEFLQGLRVDRNIFIAEITWQPIRQYFFSVKYQNRAFEYTEKNRSLSDNIFFGTFRIDY
jgi:Capsule assembly protein Wzi